MPGLRDPLRGQLFVNNQNSNQMENKTKFEQLPGWVQTIIAIAVALLCCTADNWF
jgi:hypothetical protein